MMRIRSFLETIFRKHRVLTRKSEYRSLFTVSAIIVVTVLFSAVLITVFEQSSNVRQFGRGIWDGIWWAIVTIATVGYGEKYPVTDSGKMVAIVLMFSGMGILSLLSATLSTIFITRKLQEGRGLRKINDKNHTVITLLWAI